MGGNPALSGKSLTDAGKNGRAVRGAESGISKYLKNIFECGGLSEDSVASSRCDVQIVNRFRKRTSRSLRRWWNRRSAIEPVIGHCKSEHRMNRNQLRGSLGDELNVIFAAAGFNIRKLMRAFALFLYQFFKLALIQWVYQLNQGGSKRFGKGRARV